MHILFRLFMVNLGVVIGCFAAALAFALIETWGLEMPADEPVDDPRLVLLINSALIGTVATLATYFPAAIFGVASELFRWRSILIFATAGGVIALFPYLGYFPAWINITSSGEALTQTPLKAYTAVGIIGGCAYWLVTGSKAGFRRD